MSTWDDFHGIVGKEPGTPLSADLEALIDGLDCTKGCKTRIRHACRSYNVTEVSELRENLDHLTWTPNLGPKSIGYVRAALGLVRRVDSAAAKHLSVGG